MASLSEPSCDLGQRSGKKERGKETGCRCILVRTDMALEIQSYSPYYLLGNPREVGYKGMKGYHCRSDESALFNCADTCSLGEECQ
jgi:hypothetical protein